MHVCMFVCRRSALLAGASTAQGNHFSTFVIHLPVKNYLAKVDRWLEKLNRQKWKPNDHIKRHIWSVCRNTDNNEYGFVHFSSMTSNFSTMLESKYKIWRLKLPKWTKYLFNTDITTFSGLWGSMEKHFFTESQLCIWKKVRQSRTQNDRRTYAETCHSPTLNY